jgi:Methyl-accepting chemotaxis protein (MCP) signalling domain
MPERVVELARMVSAIANEKVNGIQRINANAHLLALNAQIEAARAGAAGAGFGVVAREVKSIATAIRQLTNELTDQLQPRLAELDTLGRSLVASVRGKRLSDLALNLIEIVDRNLYERSCDVRWWATDSALVETCREPTPASIEHASKRLGIILDNYTVYCELVVCDLAGRVLAHARPKKFPQLDNAVMTHHSWFSDALRTRDGTEFAVADISRSAELGQRSVATYAAAIRARGETSGQPIGVLGVMFDWETQAQVVVDGVRLSPDERTYTRALIVDSSFQVLAASDQRGVLSETIPLQPGGEKIGHAQAEDGSVMGFAQTPGYETYKGLGWYGVLVQQRPRTKLVEPGAGRTGGKAPAKRPSLAVLKHA